MAQPGITRTLQLDPDGPPVGCTWGGRARPWGPPMSNRVRTIVRCATPARWLAVDDGNDVGWFLCDPHLNAIKRRRPSRAP